MPVYIDTDLRGAYPGSIEGYLPSAWTGLPAGQEPPSGNSSDSIRGQFVLSPTADPYDLLRQVQDAVGAGAPNVLKLFPGDGGEGFPLATWVLAPLTAICERDGYALSVDYGIGACAPLLELADFARNAPEVPILLLGEHLNPKLGFWQLLNRCPNVLLEITPAVTGQLVDEAVDRFGAHRFAFGSRDHAVPSDLLSDLDGHARDGVLRTSAEQLDKRIWRDTYL